MKEKGQTNVTLGYTVPSDGWHTAVVQEGLTLRVNEASGKESFQVPFMIEEDGEDNGKKVSIFINTRDENKQPYKSVEKQFANLLANLKLEDEFDKKFPGDVSFLEPKVITAMQMKLPGYSLMIKTVTRKDKNNNDQANIVGLDVAGADHSKDAKPANKKAAGAKTATAPSTDW